MKLKRLMREYLERDSTNQRNHGIYGLGRLRENFDTPCKVSGVSSWEDVGDKSAKDFSLPCRSSMRSFCSYIMDLEEQQGVNVSLSFDSDKSTVSLEVPHKLLGGNLFANFFKEIDNIYYDVTESFDRE